MSETNEIPVDIAETLVEHLPNKRQTTAHIGPEGAPMGAKRPSVSLIGCNGGRDVVWNDLAGGAGGSAYECGYDGSEKAAELINEVVDGVTPDDGDSIPVEFEGDKEMTEEITSHLSFDDANVELNP